MAEKKKTHELNLFSVLGAIDAKRLNFYDGLSDNEKKSYAPIVLMSYMSSLNDQNPNRVSALLLTNDIVNIGFWDLSNFPDLQHRLLCVCGQPGKNFRPWIKAKRSPTMPLTDALLMEINPWMNSQELDIFKSQLTADSMLELALDAGRTQKESKALSQEFKK